MLIIVMSGAVAILVAVGKQDEVLTGNPQISFFRTNYKRHVNFSQALLSQVIQGNPQKSAVSTITFTKKGDLLSYVFLTKKVGGVLQPSITSEDIEKVEFLIGGQIIDSLTTDQLVSLRNMNSKYPQSFRGSEDAGGYLGFLNTYHYPLGFWFCEHWQSALPLVSLQYHDVQVRITWARDYADPSTFFEAWANYIYLDTGERKHFTNPSPNDILMYQHTEAELSGSTQLNLPFNNPVIFLFGKVGTTDLFGAASPNVSDKLALRINGVDIVDKKEVVPHYTVIPVQYHTQYGKWNTTNPVLGVSSVVGGAGYVTSVTVTEELATNVNFLYPFCLNCSQLQPSGTCNFSRIDGAWLITDNPIVKPIYGRNYNVLRLQNGMGGLMFSI
jgi:hypothetical protein